MGKLLDSVSVKETGQFRIDQIKPANFALSVEKTGAERPTIDSSTEFAVRVVGQTTFWANQAQYRDGLKHATTYLAAFIYGDILRHLPELRNAVWSGDKHTAMQVIDAIEAETKP